MADNEKMYLAIGRLQSSVDDIKKHTAKIPEMATRITETETAIKYMRPKVERHQKVMWFGSGVMAVFSVVWTAALAWLEGGRGHG